jgi:hypothetical protein
MDIHKDRIPGARGSVLDPQDDGESPARVFLVVSRNECDLPLAINPDVNIPLTRIDSLGVKCQATVR